MQDQTPKDAKSQYYKVSPESEGYKPKLLMNISIRVLFSFISLAFGAYFITDLTTDYGKMKMNENFSRICYVV